MAAPQLKDTPSRAKEEEVIDLRINEDSVDYKVAMKARAEGKLVRVTGMSKEDFIKRYTKAK